MDFSGCSPADLVPFSQSAWHGMIGAYNRGHPAAVAAGVGVGVSLLRLTAGGPRRRLRMALVLLGLCWLWIAWAFLHQALGTLLWAADWLACGFALQGLALLAAALVSPSVPRAPGGRLGPGWWMLAFAVLLLPVLQWAVGRDWLAIGWFGSAPHATVIGTLGVLSLTPGPIAWPLLAVPLLWCGLAAGMLHVFQDPLWPLPLLAAALGGLLRRRSPRAAAGSADTARAP